MAITGAELVAKIQALPPDQQRMKVRVEQWEWGWHDADDITVDSDFDDGEGRILIHLDQHSE